MNDIHSILTDMWRIGSSPWRSFRMHQMRSKGNVPIFVLFYHRIADTDPNPWSMTFDEFRTQISWFQENFDVISLAEVQQRMESGSNSRPAVSITFDDGYAENCEEALPLLITEKVPVTYFVTTQHITQQTPFPHDIEDGRRALPVNTVESVRAMANAGIEIGAHTRTHINLGTTNDPTEIYDEVITATRELEDLIGKKINYFAFPYGQYSDLNADVFELLKLHGFKGVCSAYGGWNDMGSNPFHIQRVHGDPNFTRMRNWLTYDPRFAAAKEFDYSPSCQSIDWTSWLEAGNGDIAQQRSNENKDKQTENRDDSVDPTVTETTKAK